MDSKGLGMALLILMSPVLLILSILIYVPYVIYYLAYYLFEKIYDPLYLKAGRPFDKDSEWRK